MCPPNPSLRARPLPQPSFFRLMHPPLLSSLRHMHPPQYPLLRPGVLSILTPTQEYSPDLLRQTRHLPYHSSFRPKIPLQLPPSDSVRRVILSLPHAPNTYHGCHDAHQPPMPQRKRKWARSAAFVLSRLPVIQSSLWFINYVKLSWGRTLDRAQPERLIWKAGVLNPGWVRDVSCSSSRYLASSPFLPLRPATAKSDCKILNTLCSNHTSSTIPFLSVQPSSPNWGLQLRLTVLFTNHVHAA